MWNRRMIGIICAILLFMLTTGFGVNSFPVNIVSGDHSPPTITISITAPTGENGWYNSPIFIRANAQDEGEGAIRTQVSVGGTAWYNDAMRLAIDGEYMIIAKATDRAGNTARITQLVKIDMTPPEVTLTIPEPTGYENYHDKTVPIVLTGTDNLSGVVASGLEASGSSHIVGTNASVSTARLSILESGEFVVEGYVKDEAGNITPVSSELKVDIDAPVISIASPKGFNKDIELFGSAFDNESGIKYVLVDYGEGWSPVELEDSQWNTLWPAGGFEDGKYPIRAKVIDRAGNESMTEYQATIVNTLWPFFTLAALLIAVAFQNIFDPRKLELVNVRREMQRHNKMYQHGLTLGIEKDFIDD